MDSEYGNSYRLSQPGETPSTGLDSRYGDKQELYPTEKLKCGQCQWRQQPEANITNQGQDKKTPPCKTPCKKSCNASAYVKWFRNGKRCFTKTNIAFWIGLVLLLGGAITLICVGVIHVKPYLYSLGFSEGTCETVRSSYTGEWPKCGKSGNKRYPCLRIEVQVVNSSNSPAGTTVVGQLYETELDLTRHDVRHDCTYRPGHCPADKDYNEKKVAEYNATWGIPGKQYPCLYHIDSATRNFIRRRQGSTAKVIHMIVWPSLGFVVGVIIVTAIICKLVLRRKVSSSPQ